MKKRDITHEEEMFSVLFKIVRTTVLGGPIGHDLMVQARSIIRRVNPPAYADLIRRRAKAGLPDINEHAWTQEDRNLKGYRSQVSMGWVEFNSGYMRELEEAAERSHSATATPNPPQTGPANKKEKDL